MNDRLEVIIEYRGQNLPEELCRVKYQLPVIGGAAVEIEEARLEELGQIGEIKAVHRLPEVSMQMDRARKVVNCREGNYRGRGIAIAFLDTGIAPVEDFAGRIRCFRDFINGGTAPYDDNGHGTHVAGIACGSGVASKGKYRGIAPLTDIVALKTLNKEGKGSASDILAGIQWVYDNGEKYNIRIVNLSIGTPATGEGDPLVRAAEALWERGIVVVSAAGNNGPAPCSISSPGISRKIITVGSSDDENRTRIMGIDTRNYSGRGPTVDCIIKPDVVAPGNDIVSCKGNTGGYRALSGTSMSTPMVAGAIALLLEKHPRLTPDDVKYMLKLTARPLTGQPNREGWGLLNVNKLLAQEAVYVRNR